MGRGNSTLWRCSDVRFSPTLNAMQRSVTLEIATTTHVRSEKDEERLCDAFVARGGGRQRVVRFSQPRNTMQTLGVPDRRYRMSGVCFFWECKAANGKLSQEQVDFLTQEIEYGCPVGVGTCDDLVKYVNTLLGVPYGETRRTLGCQLGLGLIATYQRPAKRAKRGKL